MTGLFRHKNNFRISQYHHGKLKVAKLPLLLRQCYHYRLKVPKILLFKVTVNYDYLDPGQGNVDPKTVIESVLVLLC